MFKRKKTKSGKLVGSADERWRGSNSWRLFDKIQEQEQDDNEEVSSK